MQSLLRQVLIYSGIGYIVFGLFLSIQYSREFFLFADDSFGPMFYGVLKLIETFLPFVGFGLLGAWAGYKIKPFRPLNTVWLRRALWALAVLALLPILKEVGHLLSVFSNWESILYVLRALLQGLVVASLAVYAATHLNE